MSASSSLVISSQQYLFSRLLQHYIGIIKLRSTSLEIIQTCSFGIDFQISVLEHPSIRFHRQNFPWMFIGNYNMKVIAISLVALTQSYWKCSLSIDTGQACGAVPDSLLLIEENDDLHLLCSLRNGNLLVFPLEIDSELCKIEHIMEHTQVYPYWKGSVRLFQDSYMSHPVLVSKDCIAKIDVIGGQLLFTPLPLDSNVNYCAGLRLVEDSREFMVVLQNQKVAIHDGIFSNRTRRENIKLDGKLTPTLIRYDECTDTMVMLTSTKQNLHEITIQSCHDCTRQTSYLQRKNEFVTCMEIWKLKDGKRRICMGMKIIDDYGSYPKGALRMFSLKYSASKCAFVVAKTGELMFREEVTAIQPFGNQLLITYGSRLARIKLTYGSRQEKSNKLSVDAEISTRIRSSTIIRTLNNDIYIAGRGYIELYRYHQLTFSFTFTAGFNVSRDIRDMLIIRTMNYRAIVLLSRDGWIGIISDKTADTMYDTKTGLKLNDVIPITLKLICSFHIRENCNNLFRTSLIPLYNSLIDANAILASWDLDNRPKNELVGMVTSGCNLVGLIPIAEYVHQALVRLQDIMSNDPDTRPLLGGTLSEYRYDAKVRFNDSKIIDGLFVTQFLNLRVGKRGQLMKIFNSVRISDQILTDQEIIGILRLLNSRLK